MIRGVAFGSMLLVSACVVDEVDLAGKACPCPAPEWACGPEQRCVRASSSSAASSGSGATTGSGGGAENLLFNGDLEGGCAASWTSDGPLVDETAAPHGGSRACQVCDGDGAGVFVTTTAAANVSVAAGERLRLRAWVRAGAGGFGAPVGLRATLLDEGDAYLDERRSDDIPLGASFDAVELVVDVPAGVARVGPLLLTNASAACFVFDDVTVTRE